MFYGHCRLAHRMEELPAVGEKAPSMGAGRICSPDGLRKDNGFLRKGERADG